MNSISVIICTRNRADSLRETLHCLSVAERDGIQAEVVVVDNAGTDNTKEVVETFSGLIPVRYLYEPTLGVFGKSHALNRALDAGGLGEIIAVLDDDMSPHKDWFTGAIALCKRWPDKDIFAGNTYIVWPSDTVPDWAKNSGCQGVLFSSLCVGNVDAMLEEVGWFSGNHFWFRSRVLDGGRRFKDIWLTEPDFQLNLVELGFGGVAGPDALAGHRIQPALLERKVALERARKCGAEKAWVRLRPYRQTIRQARLFHEHPWLARIFCFFNWLRWRILYFASCMSVSAGARFERRVVALERFTLALEYLRAARGLKEYSVWRRWRGGDEEGGARPRVKQQ